MLHKCYINIYVFYHYCQLMYVKSDLLINSHQSVNTLQFQSIVSKRDNIVQYMIFVKVLTI